MRPIIRLDSSSPSGSGTYQGERRIRQRSEVGLLPIDRLGSSTLSGGGTHQWRSKSGKDLNWGCYPSTNWVCRLQVGWNPSTERRIRQGSEVGLLPIDRFGASSGRGGTHQRRGESGRFQKWGCYPLTNWARLRVRVETISREVSLAKSGGVTHRHIGLVSEWGWNPSIER